MWVQLLAVAIFFCAIYNRRFFILHISFTTATAASPQCYTPDLITDVLSSCRTRTTSTRGIHTFFQCCLFDIDNPYPSSLSAFFPRFLQQLIVWANCHQLGGAASEQLARWTTPIVPWSSHKIDISVCSTWMLLGWSSIFGFWRNYVSLMDA